MHRAGCVGLGCAEAPPWGSNAATVRQVTSFGSGGGAWGGDGSSAGDGFARRVQSVTEPLRKGFNGVAPFSLAGPDARGAWC